MQWNGEHAPFIGSKKMTCNCRIAAKEASGSVILERCFIAASDIVVSSFEERVQ